MVRAELELRHSITGMNNRKFFFDDCTNLNRVFAQNNQMRKYDMEESINLFQDKVRNIGSMLKDIVDRYIDSRVQDKEIKEAYFAASILQVLVEYRPILAFLSKLHKKDLIDSLVTHSIKYLSSLEQYQDLKNSEDQRRVQSDTTKNVLDCSNLSAPEIFRQNLEIIKKDLQDQSASEALQSGLEKDLAAKDFDTICKLVSTITDSIKCIFSEQNHNETEIDHVIAMSIGMSFSSMSIGEQELLIDDINAVREMWNFEPGRVYACDDNVVLFLKNFRDEMVLCEYTKSEDVFCALVDHLIVQKMSLESCSDGALLALYIRIRNNTRILNMCPKLFFAIHSESMLRYQLSRPSPDAYLMLDKFQKFDALISHFESMQNNATERYLITKDVYHDLVDHIEQNAEIIVFLKLMNDRSLITILDKLDNHLKSTANDKSIHKLVAIRDTFSKSADHDLQKKFDSIDQFQLYALKKVYKRFFDNFVMVINAGEGYQDYLKSILDKSLAKNYYIDNPSSSVDKLRRMYRDRAEVEALFSKVNLLCIFTNSFSNNITSLDFRDKIKRISSLTTKQFGAVLIQSILQDCTAFQLEALYNTVLHQDLNAVEKFLKQEIIKQIHFRSSISKMLVSMFSGRSQEYKKLKELSKKSSASK